MNRKREWFHAKVAKVAEEKSRGEVFLASG